MRTEGLHHPTGEPMIRNNTIKDIAAALQFVWTKTYYGKGVGETKHFRALHTPGMKRRRAFKVTDKASGATAFGPTLDSVLSKLAKRTE